MKKFLFLILAIANIADAQWFSQTSGVNNNLTSIQFIDQNTGWVVRYDGTILKTTNGGTEWISQSSGTVNHLNGISFTDANNGTVVGGYRTRLRTTNGGITWILQTGGTLNSADYDVFFTDANIGIVVGDYGRIDWTTNGGVTWNFRPIGSVTSWLYRVSFSDANNGMVVGIENLPPGLGLIFRTTNGGNTWISQTSGTTNRLNSVSFTNANVGTVVGYSGTILRTTNGGTTWISQTSGTSYHLQGVSFTDEYNGTAVGWSGTILRTTNGGTNWVPQISGTTTGLNSVYFVDHNTGWVVGHGGTILKTINGGVIPVELTSFTAVDNNSTIHLTWSTASELNNYGFEIERSSDETDWRTIGFREGNGTTTEQQNYSFIDDLFGVNSQKLFYRLKQIDFDGTFEYSEIVEVDIAPLTFALHQNYPNPFNPSTIISWQSPVSGWQTIKVFDVLGREVATLVDEYKEAGYHEVEFNLYSDESQNLLAGRQGLTSGVYFYQLRARGPETSSGQRIVETKKMILLR